MVSSLNSVSLASGIPRYPREREFASGKPMNEDRSSRRPDSTRPILSNIVGEINSAVRGLTHDLRIELDLGAGGMGARLIDNTGDVHHFSLVDIVAISRMIRQSEGGQDGRGLLVNEKA